MQPESNAVRFARGLWRPFLNDGGDASAASDDPVPSAICEPTAPHVRPDRVTQGSRVLTQLPSNARPQPADACFDDVAAAELPTFGQLDRDPDQHWSDRPDQRRRMSRALAPPPPGAADRRTLGVRPAAYIAVLVGWNPPRSPISEGEPKRADDERIPGFHRCQARPTDPSDWSGTLPPDALVADHLERLGLAYAGIFPNSRTDGDVLRMQSLHRVRVKADDIAVALDHGRELLDHGLTDLPQPAD